MVVLSFSHLLSHFFFLLFYKLCYHHAFASSHYKLLCILCGGMCMHVSTPLRVSATHTLLAFLCIFVKGSQFESL